MDRRAFWKRLLFPPIWLIVLLVAASAAALVLGAGMSLALADLPGVNGNTAMLTGIPVGLVGIVLAVSAYPLYQRILKRERQRAAPEVLRLSEELLQ